MLFEMPACLTWSKCDPCGPRLATFGPAGRDSAGQPQGVLKRGWRPPMRAAYSVSASHFPKVEMVLPYPRLIGRDGCDEASWLQVLEARRRGRWWRERSSHRCR